jgi:hypothetical protein
MFQSSLLRTEFLGLEAFSPSCTMSQGDSSKVFTFPWRIATSVWGQPESWAWQCIWLVCRISTFCASWSCLQCLCLSLPRVSVNPSTTLSCWVRLLISWLVYSSTVKMERKCFSETSASPWAAWNLSAEDGTLQLAMLFWSPSLPSPISWLSINAEKYSLPKDTKLSYRCASSLISLS